MDENRKFEIDRLQNIQKDIERKLDQLNQYLSRVTKDVMRLRRTFWDDVSLNLDSFSETDETMLAVQIQADMISEREMTQERINKRQKLLMIIKESPYFARIDFIENGKTQVENIYLGVASLVNETDETLLIYDWRAPIASLYYDAVPGIVQYQNHDTIIEGEMTLKRQFIIKKGQLKTMLDTKVTIGDELLIEILGNQASASMGHIVATIQKEQNQIIRNLTNKHILIQGVAGSGKTSVVLQRIAFLLYHQRHELSQENMLLFTPNPLFSSYIAHVLPSLGEDNIEQTNFYAYLNKHLSKQFKLETPYDQLESLLCSASTENTLIRKAGIAFKSSLSFKKLIDLYLDQLSQTGMIFKNIRFRGEKIITQEEISNYFYQLNPNSIPNRLQETMKWLLKELTKHEKQERSKDWVIEELNYVDIDLLTASENVEPLGWNEQLTDAFVEYQDEEKQMIEKIVSEQFKPLRQAVKKLKFVNIPKLYAQLFRTEPAFAVLFPSHWEKICQQTRLHLRKQMLLYEDGAPYFYFHDQIIGQRNNPKIKHLFIDEGQDYTPFHFALLREQFPKSYMTILGDKHQAIFTYSALENLLEKDNLGDHFNRIELTKSYRSTKQIIEFSKHLLQNVEIEAVSRNGQIPTLTQVVTVEELYPRIIQRLTDLQKQCRVIAVIGKTMKACIEANCYLREKFDVQLIEKSSQQYHEGIVIIPAYLAKGIEFDAVLILNAAASEYHENDLERNLLYTACTRAMHELHLYSLGEVTPLIHQVPKQYYQFFS